MTGTPLGDLILIIGLSATICFLLFSGFAADDAPPILVVLAALAIGAFMVAFAAAEWGWM